MQYNLLLPRTIRFGWGRRAEVAEVAKPLGRRAVIINGSRTLDKSGVLKSIVDALHEAGIESTILATISHEPEVADVDDVVNRYRESGPTSEDFVLGIGGGSAIDLAKAVAALATNRHGNSVVDFLEGVGQGLTIDQPPLPVLAMPTTAGTGSEATKNAVISSYDPLFKKSLRSERMVPDAVLVDPELAVSVPAHITARCGMDAITQLIEAHISRRTNPFIQSLCLDGLAQALPAIQTAVDEPADQEARTAMAHAALLSGIALANAGLGMAHGVAAALGVHARVPHGLACAVMLPVSLRTNRDVSQEPLAEIGHLIAELAEETVASDEAAVDLLIEVITELCSDLGIPSTLTELSVEADSIPDLVASSRGNSMNGNPRELTDDELTDILEEML